jgi:hypothetical protein
MRLDRLDLNKVRVNVRQASTEDLLDRASAFRDGMEPEALDLIEAELRARGVGPEEVAARAEAARGRGVPDAGGVPRECYHCRRPAAGEGWVWHRLWGVLPLFPRRAAFCEAHRPCGATPA